jgi:hypothetical protein
MSALLLFFASSSVARTVTLAVGAFALAGQPLAVEHAGSSPLATGVFVETGEALASKHSAPLATGVFVETGEAANPVYASSAPLNPRLFRTTASLSRDRRVIDARARLLGSLSRDRTVIDARARLLESLQRFRLMPWTPKNSESVEYFYWDFTLTLAVGDTVASLVAIEVQAPDVLLVIGTPTRSGAIVKAQISGGTPGQTYLLTSKITTTLGETLPLVGTLLIR